MKLIIKLLINGLAVFMAAQLVSGIQVKGFATALLVALVLALINTLIRPILILLTLPINIMTLGLFTFVINACLFWLTGSLVPGFSVSNFASSLLGAVIVSFTSWLLNLVWKEMRK